MAALQIRAIPWVSLWFAPSPDPKSIAFICSIKHATLHWAAAAIKQFTAGLDADSYAHTPLVYSAVERKFEIIGEALNQLDKAQAELAARIPHLPQIVAFRNQLIHGYARVDHDTVWEVIEHSLPALETVVNELLQELGQG